MYGDMCFGCSGKSVVLGAGKAADIVAEYREAVSRQGRIAGHDMEPGDEVRHQHAAKTDPYQTVASVEDTGKWCGSSRVGSEPEKVYHYQLVTFADGATKTVGPELWFRRVTIERAPYVERAQVAYVAKLRRQRKPVPA
jgi:hypothetical protein